MAADSIRIFFWIVVLLINCVITPYEAYWVHKLMANRNKVIIQKRRPRLLFVSLLSIWIFGLLLLPIAALLDHIDILLSLLTFAQFARGVVAFNMNIE